MKLRTIAAFLLITGLAACAQAPVTNLNDLPGFWSGLWHGFILPYSFAGSLISDSISIYSFPNSGGWYDFGFVLGANTLVGLTATR